MLCFDTPRKDVVRVDCLGYRPYAFFSFFKKIKMKHIKQDSENRILQEQHLEFL